MRIPLLMYVLCLYFSSGLTAECSEMEWNSTRDSLTFSRAVSSVSDLSPNPHSVYLSDTIVSQRAMANASFQKIEEQNTWVDSFSNEDIQELPVGVKHIMGNIEYAIGITEARFTKDYTELTVFARIKLPQTNENGYPIELFFGANNVILSHEGGIVGDANLVLLGDLTIPFNANQWMLTLKGGFDYRTGNVLNSTYVTINCDGVKELGLQGDVEISRNLVLPIDPQGNVDLREHIFVPILTENGTQTIEVPNRVKGAFNMVASDWNDLLVGIDLQPFTLSEQRNGQNYDGNFQFFINQAVLDFSDIRNDPNISNAFPNYYYDNGLLLPNERTWRGVYVNTVEVRMPSEFKTSQTIDAAQNRRVAFGAHHLLIDNYGVSGTFYGDNIFDLNEGRTNESKAWAYSLDHIEVTIAANHFIGAGIEGRILLPVSNSESDEPDNIGLRYLGLISPEEYLLNVSTDSIIDFNLWKAKGQLLPNSSIELVVSEGKFKPKAILHGNLDISAEQNNETPDDGAEEGKLVEFEGIVFQNLVLQTESPVFAVDYMGYTGEVKLANFPVSISNIGITSNPQQANLYFDLAINLMGENNGFAAQTSLGVLGRFEEENYKQKWNFDGVLLDAISLDADMGGFSMGGSLTLMDDDPEYGDGFAASLNVELKSGEGINIAAKGIFGKTDFRYWQFDALVDNLPPIGLAGVINLEGFSGGASYRMRRTDFGSSFSPTGIGYTPDQNSGLGLKAMVMFNAVKSEVLSGGAGFEIAFNTNGGIDFLGYYGQATLLNVDIPGMGNIEELMGKLKENTVMKEKFLGVTNDNVGTSWSGRNLLDKAEGEFPQVPKELMSISAELGITYDFQNEVLHGELDSFVNVPGNFVQGVGPNGRAGWAVLHFSPEEWYVYIGTPEDRLGLRIGIGPLSVETGGYFMAGSILPDSPPPPPEVASILGVEIDELDSMRDENALQSGAGFAFGSNFSIDTGDLRFLIFYASFQAGAGFDIMLRDYGDAQCSNTGDQVGIDGWYANGQAYAYLQGELGVRVKLFFINKKIPIIKGAAAVLLQAKAPNPIWMRGYMGGNYNLLGGLVKGSFRFKLTIGEECVFDEDAPLGGLKIITDVSPDDGVEDIDVFAIPEATFSMRVGEPLIIPEDEGDKTYRIDLEEFVMIHQGQEISGSLEWSTMNDRATFVSTDILPPDEQITIKVKVSFKEKINGIFKPILVNGQPAIEEEERSFTTGGAPNYIPLHNITYAYPVIDQKYFLEEEYDYGYVQLDRGQDYLFEDEAWESVMKFTKVDQTESTILDFNYNFSSNELRYTLPDIAQETDYLLQVVSQPVGGDDSDNSGTTNTENIDIGDETGHNTAIIETNVAQNLSKEGSIERLGYEFRTSAYKTFNVKINTITTSSYNWGIIYSDVIHLTNRLDEHEAFDLVELVGSTYTDNKPLVSAEATLEDSYFREDLDPYLYSNYPLGDQFTFQHREEFPLGVPPKFDLPILSSYLTNLDYGINQNILRTTFPYRYNLGLAYKQDWVNMHSQIVNAQIDGLIPSGSSVLDFLDESYLFMRYGFYKIKLSYKLPGDIDRSSATYRFKNPNNFRD